MTEKFNAAEKDDDEINSRTGVMICSKEIKIKTKMSLRIREFLR